MKEYRSIQYLRGLAALMVVVFHLAPPLERMGWRGTWPAGLSAGVDIFFVISGFVMWLTTRTRSLTPVQFWWKRIARIVPLYWLVTTFMLVVLLVAPKVMQTSVFQLRHVIASYLFFPAQNPGKAAMEPLVFPGWTLNYEMFFYLIFGLFLLVRPTVRLLGTVAVLAALVVLGIVAGAPHLSAFGFYTAPLVLEFAAGMLLAEFSFRTEARGAVPRPVALALIVAGLVVMLAMPYPLPANRVIAFGIPALAIVAGAVSAEERGGLAEWRLPHALGNASYSIYLTQLITMAAVFAVWKKLHLDQHFALLPVFCLVDVGAALVGGFLCYRLVERPLIALMGGPRRRRMADPAATGERTVTGQA